jgi:hypothetical protein
VVSKVDCTTKGRVESSSHQAAKFVLPWRGVLCRRRRAGLIEKKIFESRIIIVTGVTFLRVYTVILNKVEYFRLDLGDLTKAKYVCDVLSQNVCK